MVSRIGMALAEAPRLTNPHEQSGHDPLTGLPTRTLFLDHVQRIIQYRYSIVSSILRCY